MEEYIKYLSFVSFKEINEKMFRNFEERIKNNKAIQDVYRKNNTLNVSYNSYLLSESNLETLMEEMGFKPYRASKKKGLFAKWIDKLAKSNKKSLGNHRLDCCDMNKK